MPQTHDFRRTARALALLLSLTPILPSCGGPALPDSPARRVILITCDTLRADRLGCYGYEREDGRRTTPALDAFASECVLYDAAYAHAAMTVPSLSSLMTGHLPDDLGVYGNHFMFGEGWESLAELAQEAGYPTGAVVSNFVLRGPEHGEGDVGVAQGFDVFDDEMETSESVRQHVKERLAPDTTEAALALIEQLETDGVDRFFIWIHYQDPHGPYAPPSGWVDEFDDSSTAGVTLALAPEEPKRMSNKGHGVLPRYQVLGDQRRSGFYEDRYDGEIRYFDDAVGELLGELRVRGLVDDSLILFSADHGESLGENDYWFCHGENVQREVVRVPLLVRFPGAEGAGERRTAPVGHMDVLPTVVQALGLEQPEGLPGSSLFGEEGPARHQIQMHARPTHAERSLAVTNGRFRLVAAGPAGRKASFSLFDLEQDPDETRNVLEDHKAEFRGLRKLLVGYRIPKQPKFEPALRIMTQADKQDMSALGYAGEADVGPNSGQDDADQNE